MNSVSEYELQAVVLASTLNLYLPGCNLSFLKCTPNLCDNRGLSLSRTLRGGLSTRPEISLSYAKPGKAQNRVLVRLQITQRNSVVQGTSEVFS